MTFRLLSVLAMLTALTGACAPSFEADLNDVEVTQRGLKVPAAPSTTAAGDVSVTCTFTLSSADVAGAKHVNTDVRVHQVKIAADGSVPSLDFIAYARMTVAMDGHPGTTTEIMNYERENGVPTSSVIQVAMPVPVDITTPWTSNQTVFGFQVIGQLPAQDWTVDVTFDLSGEITYKD